METIQSIVPQEFWHNNQAYDGFGITTDKQQILLGVSSDQRCCEEFGVVTSCDDIKEFVGLDLIDIKLGDEALNPLKTRFEGRLRYVNVQTSNGLLQFTFYNSKSYYGHFGLVKSQQLYSVSLL